MLNITKITDIATPTHYSPSQVKLFLPFHQPSFADNMFSIMRFYNKENQNTSRQKYFIPDPNLGVVGHGSTNSYYSQIKTIQVQDIDGQPEHLKNSLQHGAKILNYMHTLNPKTRANSDKSENITMRSNFWIAEGSQVSEQLNFTSKAKQPEVIGYNFMKRGRNYYSFIGRNSNNNDNFPTLLGAMRIWNIERLGLTQYISLLQEQNIHKIAQNLFSSGRAFVRQVSDDYNNHHDFLLKLSQKLLSNDTSKDNFQYFLKEEEKQQSELIKSLITKCLKYKIIYKKKPTQNELWKLLSQALQFWLQQIPLNVSCSYATNLEHDAQTNTISLILISNYQRLKERQKRVQNLDSETEKIQNFFITQKKQQKQIINEGSGSQNVNNIFRRSMVILSKFQQQTQILQSERERNSDMESVRMASKPRMSPSKLQKSMTSRSLNNSYNSIHSNESSTSRTMSMQRIMKLQNNFYQLLKKQEKSQPVLSPDQMRNRIKDYICNMQRRYKKHKGYHDNSPSQYNFMLSMAKMVRECNIDDIQLLIKNNNTQTECILQVFMQPSNYRKMKELGKKLAKQHLQQLYNKSIDSGLSTRRHSILVFYLKKLMMAYADNYHKNSYKFNSVNVQQVGIPEVLQLSQTKNYKSKTYANLLKVIIPQLFKQPSQSQYSTTHNNNIVVISPILSYYHQYLIKRDHHHEIVNSFIGDILFQVCYFTDDLKLNFLSNSAYIQENRLNLPLKEKKIVQIIRQGGFSSFGYQIKTLIMPTINEFKDYEGQSHIYNILNIQKPLFVAMYFKMLQHCYYTQTLNTIVRYYNSQSQLINNIKPNKQYLCFILNQQLDEFSMQVKEEMSRQSQIEEQQQLQDVIQSGMHMSQSNIFQEIAKVNPKAKIAGLQINNLLRIQSRGYQEWVQRQSHKHKQSRQRKILSRGQDIERVVGSVQEYYELVKVSQSLKEKYIKYHILDENQKSYFRDCVSGLLQNRDKIMEYLQTSLSIRKLST